MRDAAGAILPATCAATTMPCCLPATLPADRTTTLGSFLDQYLKNAATADDFSVHLVFAANRWEKRYVARLALAMPSAPASPYYARYITALFNSRQEMLAKLRAGTTLVIDRYAFSGVAYSAAKNVPGLDIAWTKQADAGLPAPDSVLWLDLSLEVAAERAGFGGERYETSEMQQRVKANMEALRDDTWQMVDASGTLDEVAEKVWEMSLPVVESSKDKPVAGLWGPLADVRE